MLDGNAEIKGTVYDEPQLIPGVLNLQVAETGKYLVIALDDAEELMTYRLEHARSKLERQSAKRTLRLIKSLRAYDNQEERNLAMDTLIRFALRSK